VIYEGTMLAFGHGPFIIDILKPYIYETLYTNCFFVAVDACGLSFLLEG